MQVASGAVLTGYGSITGDISNAGEVDDTAGDLDVTGNYTQEIDGKPP